MLDVRLLLAVTGARRRIREQRMEPAPAAVATARMLDVPPEQVQRLALTAENACALARLVLHHQPEPAP
jgi:hypothetical protein